MKQAKASTKEAEELLRWLQARENAKFENAKDRPPAFARVVWGYMVLVDNVCDPAKDYLDWKPGESPTEIKALRDALNALVAAEEKSRAQFTAIEIDALETAMKNARSILCPNTKFRDGDDVRPPSP